MIEGYRYRVVEMFPACCPDNKGDIIVELARRNTLEEAEEILIALVNTNTLMDSVYTIVLMPYHK